MEKLTTKKFILSAAVMTFSATQVMLFTLFPVLAEKLSLSYAVIISSFALGTALFLIGSPFWTSKSETFGRFKVLGVGLFGLSLSFALIVKEFMYPSSYSLELLFVSRVIYGLTASAIVPVAQLLRKEIHQTDEHLKAMISHSFALNFGRILGPILVLLSIKNLNYILIALVLWGIFLGGKCLLMHDSVKTVEHINENWSAVARSITLPLLVTIFFTTYTGVLHSSLGNLIQKVFVIDGTEATSLMAKVLLLGSIVMALVQIIARKVFNNNYALGLFTGLALLSTGAVCLVFMQSYLMLGTAIALVCAGIALIQPSHMAMVHARHDGPLISKKIGLLSSGNVIGYAFGGMITSFFIQDHLHTLSLGLVMILCFTAFQNYRAVNV